MSRAIGTIRVFTTKNFRVIVDALPEDSPVDVDDDGETAAKVDAGEYIHFCARARVIHRKTGAELASNYLGGCIYESLEDFEDHRQGDTARCGSYFASMVSEVIKAARVEAVALRAINLRSVP